MRIFAYCRVSTTEQTTENQVLELKQAGYSIEPHRIVSEVISGSTAALHRQGFKNLIENKLEQGDKLVVTKIDRLGRDMIDVLSTIELLASKGIELVCLAIGNVDLNSASGKLFINVFAMVAQFEKDLLKERTKAGLERAKEQGKVLGRPKVLTNTQEQEILAMLKQSKSKRSLAKEYGISRQVIINLEKKNLSFHS